MPEFNYRQALADSISLDLAYFKREVPAMIDSLAERAIQEVADRVANYIPAVDAGRENDESVLPSQSGGTTDASHDDGSGS